MCTNNFQMYTLDLEKAEELEIKLPTSIRSSKKQWNSRKTSTSASLTKAFDCVNHSKLWKILKEEGIPDHLICLLRNLCAGQEATVRTRYETMELVGSKLVRSMSRLYIVILLIQLICSARHVKCQAV